MNVSFKAVVARINRKLNHRDEVLKKTRGRGPSYQSLGEYYVKDWRYNAVIETDVGVEEVARREGCLRPRDTMQPEGAAL